MRIVEQNTLCLLVKEISYLFFVEYPICRRNITTGFFLKNLTQSFTRSHAHRKSFNIDSAYWSQRCISESCICCPENGNIGTIKRFKDDPFISWESKSLQCQVQSFGGTCRDEYIFFRIQSSVKHFRKVFSHCF